MEIQKKYIEIAGKKMAVIDEGSGEPIVFLHGNPTSSYLWRNIAPNFKETNRIIVPDLMGMGDSEKLDGIDNPSYNLMGHYDFLDRLLDKLEIGNNIHFVIHDWGCALGMIYARLNSEKIKSITFMEGIAIPLTWEKWPEIARKIFSLFRSDAGEELVLEKNFFVERLLLTDPISPMSEEDKKEYLRPYINAGESRRPTLTWPRNIPLDGKEPIETLEAVKANSEFHSSSSIPKLFINADPGLLLVGEQREEIRSWKNLKEVTVKGNHFIQEDSPEEITNYLKSFISKL
tara:strand:+ start:290 stop:1156 length:867 start_codon:yes stop_codon:yes gene_type:complete